MVLSTRRTGYRAAASVCRYSLLVAGEKLAVSESRNSSATVFSATVQYDGTILYDISIYTMVRYSTTIYTTPGIPG